MDFAGGAALQVVSECPLRRSAGIKLIFSTSGLDKVPPSKKKNQQSFQKKTPTIVVQAEHFKPKSCFSFKMVGRFLEPTERRHVANDGGTATWFCDSVKESVGLESKLASLRMWIRKNRLKNSFKS